MSLKEITKRAAIILTILLVILAFRRGFKTLTKDQIVQGENVRVDTLYLPSPIEVEILKSPSVWPRQFRAEDPPTPDRVPELYSSVRGARGFNEVSAVQLERARRWSIALNSLNRPRLETSLPQMPDPAQILARKGLQDCSLEQEETLFRWSQLKPILKRDFLAYMQRCEPKSALTSWLRLQQGIEDKNVAEVERATQALRERSYVPDKSWEMWFAGEAAKVGLLTLQAWAPVDGAGAGAGAGAK